MKEASPLGYRSMVLLLALAFDWLWREPPAWAHPVVWLGKLIDLLTPAQLRGGKVTARDSEPSFLSPASDGRPTRWVRVAQFGHGAFISATTVLAAYFIARLAESASRRLPEPLALLAGAALLKPAFAVQALIGAARTVEMHLQAGDLADARTSLAALVSRDASLLDRPLVAAAAIESLAENLSDSFVAPAGYYLAFGLPGALAYRAVNTLDSMIGYRGRHEFFGKVSARADDLANIVPSRLTAALIAAAAAINRMDWPRSLLTARRDHHLTASPNAGWPMGAMAGALNVELTKMGNYRLGAEFDQPAPADIGRAVRVARSAVWLWWAISVVALLGKSLARFFGANLRASSTVPGLPKGE